MGRKKLGEGEGKTGIISLRMTPKESQEFEKYAESIGIKRNPILLKIVRELVNDEIHLSKPEMKEFQAALAQLTAIGRNLNQLTRSANKAALAGEPLPKKLQETQLFEAIHHQLDDLKATLNTVLDHTEQRWLRAIDDDY